MGEDRAKPGKMRDGAEAEEMEEVEDANGRIGEDEEGTLMVSGDGEAGDLLQPSLVHTKVLSLHSFNGVLLANLEASWRPYLRSEDLVATLLTTFTPSFTASGTLISSRRPPRLFPPTSTLHQAILSLDRTALHSQPRATRSGIG